MAQTTIQLNPLPKDKEFEEFLAAYFQCGGYYIERNLIERDVAEVLELDIILTNYNVSPPNISIAEVKSGDWGFPDIFKIRGWMTYTSIRRAWLVTQTAKPNAEFYTEKAKALGIRLLQFANLTETSQYLEGAFSPRNISATDIKCWRYTYWVERNLIKLLLSKKKVDRISQRYIAMSQYHQMINGGIFFTQNIVERLEALYDAFKKNPRLSAKVGSEINGAKFEIDHKSIPTDIFSKTFYACELTDIQIATYIENSSRLTILKNAVDFTMYNMVGDKKRTEAKYKILGTEIPRFDFLPASFRLALKELSTHKYFVRYPIFWQWFLWLFGGFILLDYEEEEYKLLAEKTGIPAEEIPNALKAFDILFPIDSSWFVYNAGCNIKHLRLHSIPFFGIRANYRRLLYSSDKSYYKLKLTGQHTENDLIKWNNALVELLAKTF